MASVVAQQLFSSWKNFVLPSSTFTISVRNSSKTPRLKPVRGTIKYRHLISSDTQSLSDRGFLRFQKPYSPPPNATNKINVLVEEFFGSDVKPTDAIPKSEKYKILNAFWKEFNHSVPNSELHKICTVSDIQTFYTTPVITKNPYELLQEKDLPPNLHIQSDYVRFDPENDEMFNGISSYPESPTIITGLRSKKKYKSSSSKLPYYYYNEAVYVKD